MTLMLIIIMTSVIALSVLVNLTMLKTYYTVKEKKTIRNLYCSFRKYLRKTRFVKMKLMRLPRNTTTESVISNSTEAVHIVLKVKTV